MKKQGLHEIIEKVTNCEHITTGVFTTDIGTHIVIEKSKEVIPPKPKGNYEWNGEFWEETDSEGYYLNQH